MPITLTDDEAGGVANAIQTLLSPLVYDSTDQWRAAVNRSIKDALRADCAMFFLAEPGIEPIYSEEYDPRLGISLHTARHHTERVLLKLRVRSRAPVRPIITSAA